MSEELGESQDMQVVIDDWNEIQEEPLLENNTYDLEILNVKVQQSKDGDLQWLVQIRAVDFPKSAHIFHRMTFKKGNDRGANFAKLMIKQFLTLLGIDGGRPFSPSDLQDKVFTCAVTTTKYVNSSSKKETESNELVLPPLPPANGM